MTQRVLSTVLHSFETDNRVLRACRSLINAGYEVKVVALHEGELAVHQVVSGIDVERIRLWTRSWPKWKPIRLFKFCEWIARVGWRFRDYEIIHCNGLNTLPAGVLLKLLSFGKARVIYDAHEFESNHKSPQSRWSIVVLQMIESSMIRFADKVVTVSRGIAYEYSKLYPIETPSVVMNCPSHQKPVNEQRFRKRFNIRDDQTIFVTQGWLRPNRGIECMLEAFAEIDDNSNVLVVMGRGHLDVLVRSYADRCPNIFLHPVVPPEDVLAYTVSAEYGIALIEGTSFSYRYCLPNKLFEYVMAGLPVIVSNLPEMRRMVEELDIGVVCPEISPRALVQSIEEIGARDRAQLVNNVDKAREILNWEAQEKVWIDAIQGVRV